MVRTFNWRVGSVAMAIWAVSVAACSGGDGGGGENTDEGTGGASTEASPEVSGIFNVASGNYTIGELADYVKEAIELRLERPIALEIHHRSDVRNYKVKIDKAVSVLGFKPMHDVPLIVRDLFEHLDRFRDFDNPRYYNIRTMQEAGLR